MLWGLQKSHEHRQQLSSLHQPTPDPWTLAFFEEVTTHTLAVSNSEEGQMGDNDVWTFTEYAPTAFEVRFRYSHVMVNDCVDAPSNGRRGRGNIRLFALAFSNRRQSLTGSLEHPGGAFIEWEEREFLLAVNLWPVCPLSPQLSRCLTYISFLLKSLPMEEHTFLIKNFVAYYRV